MKDRWAKTISTVQSGRTAIESFTPLEGRFFEKRFPFMELREGGIKLLPAGRHGVKTMSIQR